MAVTHPGMLAAIENEVQILAALDHPSVVSYHGSFKSDGMLSIVMEYCDSGNLQDAIATQAALHQPFEAPMIAQWVCELASALDHIHSKKVLHRDLKVQLTVPPDTENRIIQSHHSTPFVLPREPIHAGCERLPHRLSAGPRCEREHKRGQGER